MESMNQNTICYQGSVNREAIAVLNEKIELQDIEREKTIGNVVDRMDKLETKFDDLKTQFDKMNSKLTIFIVLGLLLLSSANPVVIELIKKFFGLFGVLL